MCSVLGQFFLRERTRHGNPVPSSLGNLALDEWSLYGEQSDASHSPFDEQAQTSVDGQSWADRGWQSPCRPLSESGASVLSGPYHHPQIFF